MVNLHLEDKRNKKDVELTEVDNRKVVVGDGEKGWQVKTDKSIQKEFKMNKAMDLMYDMVTIVDRTVMYN